VDLKIINFNPTPEFAPGKYFGESRALIVNSGNSNCFACYALKFYDTFSRLHKIKQLLKNWIKKWECFSVLLIFTQ
jgi:hypothetical protein